MPTSKPAAERPLRRDAERNRQRVMAAAREVFGRDGLGATMDDIAQHAGVGVATVYRRFPDKEQLIDALFQDQIAAIVDDARQGLALEDPWDGLVHFLLRGEERQSADRGFKELLFSSRHGRDGVARARDQIAPVVTALLQRAQTAGVVRRELTPLDLPLVQLMIGTVIDYTRDVAPEVWRRYLELLLGSLRPAAEGTPLTGPALSEDQFEAAMSGWTPGRSLPHRDVSAA